MFIGHRNVPILKQNSNDRLGASKDAKWIATLSRAREKRLNTGLNNSRSDKRYLLEVFMVLQSHWVVSCNYNGEIYGVELLPGKRADLRIPKLSKEKTAVIRYYTDKDCKVHIDNQKLYNNAKRLLTKSLKAKYKNFEVVVSRVGSATAPFKVEQLEKTIQAGCWGNAKILWSERR